MSDKTKTLSLPNDPVAENARRRMQKRVAEQEQAALAAAQRARDLKRDQVGMVTIGRQMDNEASEKVKFLAKKFKVDPIWVTNFLAAGGFMREDAETGLWRLAHNAKPAPASSFEKKARSFVWRAPR
jgi:hypothetical protein